MTGTRLVGRASSGGQQNSRATMKKRIGDTVRFKLQSAHPQLNGLEGKGTITDYAPDGPNGPMVCILTKNGNTVNIYVHEVIESSARPGGHQK